MTNLPLTIEDAGAALRAGTLTSADLTSAMLDKIEHLNPRLGAFIAVTADDALAAARQADAELASGLDDFLMGSLSVAPRRPILPDRRALADRGVGDETTADA